ncbi:urease accessory protein UreE [Pedobacter gandavensis]|uniref:Urease accessory protein UreE n=1 Tax=Pedobacter gandavensis TaxID=2679963 RepID=A0ABR6ES92_9SPHI|nr:urease accessory protein UreE [Pedobacter gandavensis]MBB2148106.1 urease accessory protein UreE [Pedobacter gandavensis]
MLNNEVIRIDRLPVVQPLNNQEEDSLILEWYEVNRTIIKRESAAGRMIHLDKPSSAVLKQGLVIYQDEICVIRIFIKPCTCMVLQSSNMEMVGLFCFDVGNRHLPIYMIDDHKIAIAYDGRLFPALQQKYGASVTLANYRLDPSQIINCYGNIYEQNIKTKK